MSLTDSWVHYCKLPPRSALLVLFWHFRYWMSTGAPIQSVNPVYFGCRDGQIPDPTYQNRIEASAESRAVYGQIEYDISDLMGLTVGLRYTEDERTARRLYDLRRLGRAPD